MARWAPAAAVAMLALSGCGFLQGRQSVLDPAGPVAQGQLGLIESSFWIMIEIFIVVSAVLVVALIRFRARPGQTELPPQVHGDNRLEFLWTIVPALLLALLAVGTVKQSFADAGSPLVPHSMLVQVTGHQFWWAFTYPSLGVVTANELHVPVGQKIELALTSADVLHSFWVPRLAGKTDLVPGKINYIWFQADKPGLYYGQCAEFCGTGHADMRLIVDAQTPAKFNQWVATMSHPVSTPTTALAKEGEKLFGTIGCSTCHTVGGTTFAGAVGPSLTDLTGRLMIASNTYPNTPKNLYNWVHDAPSMKPGVLMPSFSYLKAPQVKALVAFLESLK
jgi:cytochrome c oxidase subunit 2